MKFISETTIFESWKQLIEIGETNKAPLNKFFGVLELLQHLNLNQGESPESNFQYNVFSGQLSNSLQEKYFFDFIHLSDGLPDARLIPLELLSRAMRHALIVSARNNKLAFHSITHVPTARYKCVQAQFKQYYFTCKPS